jgi:hypothetical protein
MGGSSGDPTAPQPTFQSFKFVIENMVPPCVASDCHGGGVPNPLQMPVANDDQLYNNLMTTMVAECGNIPVVTPGDPSKSALIKLLNGPCGEIPRMPKGCDGTNCVPDEYIASITQWVQMGAPKN